MLLNIKKNILALHHIFSYYRLVCKYILIVNMLGNILLHLNSTERLNKKTLFNFY